MSDDTPSPAAPKGDRIAKVLARAGVASRRDAEKIIAEGRVSVNGKVIDSPALNVTDRDRITVDDVPLAEPEPPRLWLYHKPIGLVTSARDEKGRETVFDALPEDMPRVMSVGRLDLNSEGLLLLTNDGDIARKLELPSTGWVRKYRVRVKGSPKEEDLEPLRKGITVDGENFSGMAVTLDRLQGANAWLTIGLREGRNREIRRAMEAVGLVVNRLIRVSYGPFRLGELKAGEVEEVRTRVMRDQLGLEEAPTKEPVRQRKGAGSSTGERTGRKPGVKTGRGGGKPFASKTAPWEDDEPVRKGAKPALRGKFAPRDGKPAGKDSAPARSGKTFGAKPARDDDDRGPRKPVNSFKGGKPFASGPKSGARGGKPGGRPGAKSGPRQK